jgi:putative ABC transport system substrate-binding protein
MAALRAAKVEAVQFLASPFLNALRARFIDEVGKMKVPAMYEWPETVEEGGLASYGPRIALCYRHVAVLVNKVLRGAKPVELPIEQPATFMLALNTGTARTIGLQLPEAMLLRADVVVD